MDSTAEKRSRPGSDVDPIHARMPERAAANLVQTDISHAARAGTSILLSVVSPSPRARSIHRQSPEVVPRTVSGRSMTVARGSVEAGPTMREALAVVLSPRCRRGALKTTTERQTQELPDVVPPAVLPLLQALVRVRIHHASID